jgi:hypothetical protein
VLKAASIILLDEAIIRARGWTKELLLRHEIGHYNGWRPITLASVRMMLTGRKDDDQEAQTSKAIFGAGG